ncbi:MAG: hypothetical protein IPK99_10085 [Flavobacteriales bacterium]|nr:hypothetical protein [Flavobacteriales bacterium]
MADPLATLFLDPVADDYHALNAQSQQVDAGTAAVLPVVTIDMGLVPRPQGLAFDIGCFEREQSSLVAPVAEGPHAVVTYAQGALWLSGAPAGTVLEVFDAAGRAIGMMRTNSADPQWLLVPAASALYYRSMDRSGHMMLQGAVLTF